MVPVEEVLIVDGLQVPLMPLVDEVGKAGAVLFWQIGPTCVKVGATPGLTVMVNVAVAAHCPAAGVNV